MAYQEGDAVRVIYVPRECIQKAKLFLKLKKKALVASSGRGAREIALGFGTKKGKAYFYVHDYRVLYYKELYDVSEDEHDLHAVCGRLDIVKSLLKRKDPVTVFGAEYSAANILVTVYAPPDVMNFGTHWDVAPTVHAVVNNIKQHKGIACEFDVRRLTLAAKLMEPDNDIPTTSLQVVHADQSVPTGFIKVNGEGDGEMVEMTAIACTTKSQVPELEREEITEYLKQRDIRIAMDEESKEVDSVSYLVSKTHGEVLRRIYKELKRHDGETDSV
jgi:hypothetical protein